MAPWLVALIIIAVLCGLGWLTDARARRRRRGLTNLAGPSSRLDPVAETERMEGGTAQRATYTPPGDLGGFGGF